MSSELAPWLDLMTAALRRDPFEAEVARAARNAREDSSPLALIWIDVDDLTEHNDLHGRDSLDTALSWLASRVSDLFDGRGPIGRVSGGAFAVLLPHTRREEALELSNRLRRVIPKTLHSSAFGDYRLTVSVGVASLRPSELWGNFLDAAESACVRAKQGGRDAVASR